MSRYEPRHKRQLIQKPADGARKASDWELTRRVYGETNGYRWHILLYAGLTFLATPLALLAPVPLKIVVDNVIGNIPLPSWIAALLPASAENSDGAVLGFACVLLILVTLATQVQSTGQSLLATYTGERITLRFRAKLLAHAQRLSFAFHDRRGTADSIYRIQSDAPAVQNIAISGVIPMASAILTLGSMIYVMMRIQPQLALVALAVCPVLFMSAYLFKVRMRPRYRETKRLESTASKVVQEILTSVRVIMAFGREADEEERFTEQSTKSVRARLRLAVSEGTYRLVVTGTTAVGTAVVLFIGARQVQSGDMSLGDLLLVVSYLSQLYGPLKMLSQRPTSLQNQFASVERAFALLDEVPEVRERPHARPIKRAAGTIEFRDVTFGYEPAVPVLNRISFSVRAGYRLGIVGKTGAGKTTLVSLLTRFYDPDEGGIFLDGVDLRDYRISDLRNQFSIVLQEPVLFSTSIAQNIAYARPGASHHEVVSAAEAADAADFIERLADGFDTVVGERGMRLSGGERQRISLARAFLKDAPILVLDEPTSSVDNETEASIMDAMTRLMQGRTTLMIAHRLTTLGGCDGILDIEGGRATLGHIVVSDLNVGHSGIARA